MLKVLISFIVAFFIALVIGFPVIHLMKKAKARQTILCYVEQHKQKEGIPTMGGIIFLFSTLITCLLFWTVNHDLALIALVVTLVYGGVGALDDGIKIVMKRNLGLRAYQKIISQSIIAILATWYCYKSGYVGEEVFIPILKISIHVQWWYIPLGFMIFIATTNCVNLTDGLDGLAGSTVCVYLVIMLILIYVPYTNKMELGQTPYAAELQNLMIFTVALLGGTMGFLWYNAHKAKIFMGDTGSLALGGACATIPMMIKNPFIILFAGIMFVVSGISVIVQVLVFKIKRKRVFLMAPFHHHLEKKGINESKIVSYYTIITAIAGVLSIIIS